MTDTRKSASWPMVRKVVSLMGFMLMILGMTALLPSSAFAKNAGQTASSGASGGGDGLVASTANFATGSGNQGLTENRYVGIREAARNYRYLGSYSVKTPKFARRLQVYCADPEQSSTGDYETPVLVSSFKRNDNSGTANIEAISRVNYVVSSYGGTQNKRQAAAVGAAVYHLLGYPARQLVKGSTAYRDAEAYGVLALANEYVDEATKYAGNWKMSITVTDSPDVTGTNGKIKVKAVVESNRTGNKIPDAKVTVDYTGDSRGSKSERTDSKGVATFEFDPEKAGNFKLRASVLDTPGASVYQASPKKSGSQRMFVGGNTRDLNAEVSIKLTTPPPVVVTPPPGEATPPPGEATPTPEIPVTPPPAVKISPEVITQTSGEVVGVGESIFDTVFLSEGPDDYEGTASGTLYGPYQQHPVAADCKPTDPTVGTVGLSFSGNGEYRSGSIPLDTGIGYYTWVWDFPEMATDEWEVDAFTTECGIPEETTLALAVPSLETLVSNQDASVGETITDYVFVSGMPAETTAQGTWQLHGPIPSGPDGTCLNLDWSSAPLANSGRFTVYNNETIEVGEHTVTAPGCYTYTESLDASDRTFAFPMTDRGIESETTHAKYTPQISTQVSDAFSAPGVTITDDVVVTGTGGSTVDAEWRLLGPVQPDSGGSCANLDWTDAAEAAGGTFTVNGDGTYTVGEYTVEELGCYTYTERLLESDSTHSIDWHEIGIPSETTLSKASPEVTTEISEQSVEVGAELRDTISLTGTHGATVDVSWRLHGPAAPVNGSCADIDWADVQSIDRGTMSVTGDGDYRTPPTEVGESGCYTYTAKIDATPVSDGFDWHDLGLSEETAVVRATPALTTQVSEVDVAVGDSIHDTITVTDLAGLDATIEWRLMGPVDPVENSCLAANYDESAVAAEGSFDISGDGDYGVDETGHEVVDPGCYTYTARIVDGFDVAGVEWHALGLEAETTLAVSEVGLSTQVSATEVKVGDTVTDVISLEGLFGRTPNGLWELYGPVDPSEDGTCVDLDWSTSPLADDGTFTAEGDGIVETDEYTVEKPGCYTYSAMIEATDVTTGVDWHDLGLDTETFSATEEPVEVPPVKITSGKPSAVSSSGPLSPSPFIAAVLLVFAAGLAAGAGLARKATR